MRATTPVAGGPLSLEFASRPSWLAWVLCIVPGLIVLQSGYVLLVKPVPLTLLLLLVMVIGTCGMLAVTALDAVMPTTVALTQDGVEIKRQLGTKTFGWSEIEDIKLVPAPGTISDDPTRKHANRIGVGLFLRATAKDRTDPNLADAILFVGTDEDTGQLLGIMEQINSYRSRRGSAPRGPARIGAGRARTTRSGTELRRN
jgi:hypothetical protein